MELKEIDQNECNVCRKVVEEAVKRCYKCEYNLCAKCIKNYINNYQMSEPSNSVHEDDDEILR